MVALNGTRVNGFHVNGSDSNHQWSAPATERHSDPAAVDPDDVVASLMAERARLEAEIIVAEARAAAARSRAAARDAELREALREELASSQELLAEMERQHDATIARVRAVAAAEAERILIEARRPGVDDAH